MTTTYSINLTDSEQTPAWMALCATATPGAQDSGRVRYTVTTEQPAALEAALNADADVLTYEAQEGGEAVTEAVHLIERSISHNEIAHADWTPALAEALLGASDDHVEASDTVIEFWGTSDGSEWRVHLDGPRASADDDAEHVHCECGAVTGERCQWTGPRSATVVVEHMPRQHRASHTAARNRGMYPYNGAIRIRVEESCATTLVEGDEGWTEIVEE